MAQQINNNTYSDRHTQRLAQALRDNLSKRRQQKKQQEELNQQED